MWWSGILVEEQFCEIIFNLDQWLRSCCLKKYLIYKVLSALSIGRAGTILCNFGKGHYEEQVFEVILNLDQWFRSSYHLKIFRI